VIALGISMIKGGDIIQMGKALEPDGRADSRGACRPASSCTSSRTRPKVVSASVNEFVGTLIEAVVIVLGW
jgi:multidrug efflux pump subunit AcrB